MAQEVNGKYDKLILDLGKSDPLTCRENTPMRSEEKKIYTP